MYANEYYNYFWHTELDTWSYFPGYDSDRITGTEANRFKTQIRMRFTIRIYSFVCFSLFLLSETPTIALLRRPWTERFRSHLCSGLQRESIPQDDVCEARRRLRPQGEKIPRNDPITWPMRHCCNINRRKRKCCAPALDFTRIFHNKWYTVKPELSRQSTERVKWPLNACGCFIQVSLILKMIILGSKSFDLFL